MNANGTWLQDDLGNGIQAPSQVFAELQPGQEVEEVIGSAHTQSLLLPFRSHASLMHKMLNEEELGRIQFERLKVGDVGFNWITANFPEGVWAELPLLCHQMAEPTAERREFLREALQHIALNHKERFAPLVQCANNFVWLERTHETIGTHETLGSEQSFAAGSFPELPLCVFVTNKALRHLQPSTITAQKSVRFLAENILHELLQHKVGEAFLKSGCFQSQNPPSDGGDILLPQVEVPWRCPLKGEQVLTWQLDRALREMAVWTEIFAFRKRELMFDGLADFERNGFLDSGRAAIETVAVVHRELHRHRACFSNAGQKLASELCQKTELAASEFKHMLSW